MNNYNNDEIKYQFKILNFYFLKLDNFREKERFLEEFTNYAIKNIINDLTNLFLRSEVGGEDVIKYIFDNFVSDYEKDERQYKKRYDLIKKMQIYFYIDIIKFIENKGENNEMIYNYYKKLLESKNISFMILKPSGKIDNLNILISRSFIESEKTISLNEKQKLFSISNFFNKN